MSHTFISYKREDRDRAERVVRALQASGVAVWWDPSIRGGQAFNDAIELALEDASAVVVLWSAGSVASRWVRDEATVGVNCNIFVPVLIDAVQPPLGFRQVQSTDLSTWDGDAMAPAFQRLLEALSALAERPRYSRSRSSGEFHLPPKVGDGYVLSRLVASTPKNAIYKAVDRNYRGSFALKCPIGVSASRVIERVRDEARFGGAVDHPNVCRIVDSWTNPASEGSTEIPSMPDPEASNERLPAAKTLAGFVAMTFLDGETLLERTERGRIPLPVAIELLAQACDGLHHIHERNIVFRDVKPENIMLVETDERTDRAVVFDFDMAITEGAPADGGLTQGETVLGTPAFMSPEQVTGLPLYRTSDIYQFGVVAYETLAGRLPFRGRSDETLMMARLTERPLPLGQARSGLPANVTDTIMRCLERDPAARPQSMREVARALRGSSGFWSTIRRSFAKP